MESLQDEKTLRYIATHTTCSSQAASVMQSVSTGQTASSQKAATVMLSHSICANRWRPYTVQGYKSLCACSSRRYLLQIDNPLTADAALRMTSEATVFAAIQAVKLMLLKLCSREPLILECDDVPFTVALFARLRRRVPSEQSGYGFRYSSSLRM